MLSYEWGVVPRMTHLVAESKFLVARKKQEEQHKAGDDATCDVKTLSYLLVHENQLLVSAVPSSVGVKCLSGVLAQRAYMGEQLQKYCFSSVHESARAKFFTKCPFKCFAPSALKKDFNAKKRRGAKAAK